MPRKPNIDNGRYNDPFPTTLRQLMDKRGTRQEDLISVLGVKNRQSVTGYRDGSTLPTIDKLVNLAKYFNVSTDYLLGLAETPSPNEDVRKIQTTTGLSDKFIEYVVSKRGKADIDGINLLLSDIDVIHEVSKLLLSEQRDLKITLEQIRGNASSIAAHDGDVKAQFYSIKDYSGIYEAYMFLRLNHFELKETISSFLDEVCRYSDAIDEISDGLNTLEDVLSAYESESNDVDDAHYEMAFIENARALGEYAKRRLEQNQE